MLILVILLIFILTAPTVSTLIVSILTVIRSSISIYNPIILLLYAFTTSLGFLLTFRNFRLSLLLIIEITAQLPYSYNTLGCCSLVNLLPRKYCRLHYSKVQSPQPRGVSIMVQGATKPPGPTGTH